MDWMQAAQNFGVPAGMLVAVLWMLWKGGSAIAKWLADKVIGPLVTKHLEFMDSAMKSIAKVADNVEMQTAASAKIAGALSTIQARLGDPKSP